MGDFYACRCSNCDFSFNSYTGSGLLYDTMYRSVIEQIYLGYFGDVPKEFIEDNPEGIFDIDYNAYQCTSCHLIVDEPSLNMYLPEDTKSSIMSAKYKLHKKYTHRCKKCGHKMIRILGKNRDLIQKKDITILRSAKCPQCSNNLIVTGFGKWD